MGNNQVESGMKILRLKLTALILSLVFLIGVAVLSLLPLLSRKEDTLSSQRILMALEETEYWVAYESPSEHGFSLAWGNGYLWMADVFDGVIYKARETKEGLEIVNSWDLRIQPSEMFQARDLTWDGKNLWSVDWGSLLRHDVEQNLEVNLDINEDDQDPPWENMHHLWNIAWDGEYMWSSPGLLNRHNKKDYHVEAVYPLDAQPMDMAFKGKELWVSDSVWGYIQQFDMSQLPSQGYPSLGKKTCDCFDLQAEIPEEVNPRLIKTYSIVERPYGITWSDNNLWVYDLATKLIYKIKKLPDFPLDPKNEYLREEKYTIPREITGNVTWTLDKSPYVVDSIDVPPRSILTIEPGVKIFVRGEVIIQGTLKAVGTPDKPIIFTHVDWDKPTSGDFFFGDPTNEPVYSEGEGALVSVLKYVVIEYFQGIKTLNAIPTIEYSVIRKNGAINLRLEKGNYSTLKFVGNKISEGGDGIKIEIGPEAKISDIVTKENVFKNINGAPIYIEYRGEKPLEVLIEHNILDYAHGAAHIFDGTFNLVFRYNLINDMVAYRGIQPPSNSEVSYNFIRHTFQAAIQLDAPDLHDAIVRYNTIIDGIVDSDFGRSGVIVEYNNILYGPEVEVWASGLDAWENRTAKMPRNWWGTPDLEEVKRHVIDSSNAEDRGSLIIEPILTEPNGIGFIRGLIKDKTTGKPISEAKIAIGNITLSSAVNGEFFSALPEGLRSLTLSAAGYQTRNLDVKITAGEIETLVLELES